MLTVPEYTYTHTLPIASVCQLAFGSVSYGQLTPGILLMTVIFLFYLLHNQHCAPLSYITAFSSSCLGLPLLRAQTETWVAGVCVHLGVGEEEGCSSDILHFKPPARKRNSEMSRHVQ